MNHKAEISQKTLQMHQKLQVLGCAVVVNASELSSKMVMRARDVGLGWHRLVSAVKKKRDLALRKKRREGKREREREREVKLAIDSRRSSSTDEDMEREEEEGKRKRKRKEMRRRQKERKIYRR